MAYREGSKFQPEGTVGIHGVKGLGYTIVEPHISRGVGGILRK